MFLFGSTRFRSPALGDHRIVRDVTGGSDHRQRGFVFGLAVGIAGANPKMANPAALLLLGIIPAAVIIYFTSVLGVGWLTLYINDLTAFLITPSTVTVSCVAVGLLAAALIGTRTAQP